ncbi:MAG TPA: S8 family serine peptidase [Dehalococcoidia bacterium]|nr:S8 family serine peptidase [Dehalococcoidia bacterium]
MLAIAAVGAVVVLAASHAPPGPDLGAAQVSADAHRRDSVPGEIVVQLRAGSTTQDAQRIATSVGGVLESVNEDTGVAVLNLPPGRAADKIPDIENDLSVLSASQNYIAEAAEIPNDPGFSSQWHLQDSAGGIDAPAAWDSATNEGSGVTVAIIDTGLAYEYAHDAQGRSFAPSPEFAPPRVVDPWDFTENDEDANDDNGHGTHVASTIGGTTNNGFGTAGIASNVSIMPLKALSWDGTGKASDVIDAIYYAINHHANIINMSLAFPGSGAVDGDGYYCNEIAGLPTALDYAQAHGVTVIAAAGNGATNVACPAAFPSVIAVGATRLDGTATGYSNVGNALDVVAPGGDPAQDLNNDGQADGIIQNTYCQSEQVLHATLNYTEFCNEPRSGTSQATAVVSGVAALLLGQSPDLNPHQMRNLLQGTARDGGAAGWDAKYGWGLVDAKAAVDSLTGGVIPPDSDPGQSGPDSPGANSPESYPPSVQSLDLSFVRVIDGDSIEFWNGSDWGVRYLGVDVPAGNTECGREATAKNWELTGAGVHLEQEAPYDIDARGLRLYHAFMPDGTLVGEELIREGLARASNEDNQYKQRYLAAQADAEANGRGCLWGANAASLNQPSDQGPVVPSSDMPVSAQAIPPVPGFEEDVVATGLDNPTTFDYAPDGRIFIAEKTGVVKVYKNGALLPTPLIDIHTQVNDYWDHGLLGLAVDPNFASNGYLYLLFTYENDAGDYYGFKTGRLIRVTVVGDTASIATAVTLLGTTIGSTCNAFPDGTDCIPSDSPSHSVGGIDFGPDGLMYITLGDGAHFNFVDTNATRTQNLDLLSGKVLRINPNGTGLPDNPYWNGNANSNRSKVWAYGVRNAFRLNVRDTTGTVYLGDVGWNTWEEVNIVRKGANLGWPCYEGVPKQTGYGDYQVCTNLWAQGASAVLAPFYAWNHNGGGAAAVGGDFSTFYPPPYKDAFFFADYVQSWIKYAQVDANDNVISINDFADSGSDGPVSFQTAANGDIYYLAINSGELRQLHSTTGNRNPTAIATATPTNGHAPLAVQFNGSGSTDPDNDPLTYSWNFGDGGTSTQANPSHTYTTNNVYTAVLTVHDNRNGVATASIAITVGNTQPTPVITAPLATDHYRTGDVIQFAGSATDPEDPSIPASALSWTIILHHNTHTHAFLSLTGDHGLFTVPDHGDQSWFEIKLTATDSGGLQASTTVWLYPQELQLTLASVPSTGPTIVYSGTPVSPPYTVTTIANSVRTITANSPQFNGNQQYVFNSWSDGGAANHDINVGTTSHTVTASFTASTVQPVTFDDLTGQNLPITGQYPSGLIDWGGSGAWWHSEPYGLFDTRNLTFNGQNITSASFSFLTPHMLLQIDAYNGGPATSTVTLSCPGQLSHQETLPAGTMMSINPGWTNPCTTVTISSSNGWDTNFDNFMVGAGGPDTTPPGISNVAATNLTATTGTITWTTDETATSRVEYGLTTSYGTLTPLDSNQVTSHSVNLSGLTASTTYHYHVISTDAANNTATSGDFTFTTPSSSPTSQTVTFDDLAGQNVPITGQYPTGVINWGSNGVWLHSEPFGLLTTKNLTYNGPGVTSATFTFVTAQKLISVKVYNGGIASTTVTLSCPGQTNKTQSVAQGALVTITTGWTATCSSVTMASTNGWDTNYDDLSIQSGTTDTTPPTISAVTATNITTSGATITWTTNEPATSRVEYGLTTSYGTLTAVDSNLVTSHSVNLSGLTANTPYHYHVLSSDAANNPATSGDFTFTTAADTTPPVISNVAATNVTNAGATITWTTNEAATSRVEYGLTTSYGTLTTLDSNLVTSHSVNLSGLSPSTPYHFHVLSSDAANNPATSGDFSFTTAAAPDTTPPVITNVASSNLTTSGATITWTTDEPATSRVEYGTTTSYGAFSALDSSLVTSHSVNLSGLAPNTPYHFRVLSSDAANNPATSVDFTFTTAADTTAPVISNVAAGNLAATSATITWTTNEPATSRVEYGLTTSYGTLTTLDSNLITSHSVNLTGLTASTTYHYRVLSSDAANNPATSGDFTFTTPSSVVTQTITFDDIAGQNQALNGQYPAGVINWGNTNVWLHSEPFGLMTTTNLTYNGGTITSATFTFLTPQTLVSLQAYNGGTAATTVTLSCPGQTNKTQSVAKNAMVTITTGWAAGTACSTVTIASTNGWDTNFDNLVIQSTGADTTPPVISNVAAGSLAATGATITWTTNEPANSRVEYGLTTSYGTLTTLDSNLVTSHSVTLSGLTASTTYHYRVLSADGSNNPATSGDFTFTTSSSSTQTIIFDDKAGQNVALTGQYPTGVINWGSNGNWWLSEPYGQLTTKNLTFNGGVITSASFTFVTAQRLVSVQAYNGGVLGTTVTISCTGQTTKTQSVAPNTLVTISTGWTGTCTSVTIASTNGWDTNFDNLVISSS